MHSRLSCWASSTTTRCSRPSRPRWSASCSSSSADSANRSRRPAAGSADSSPSRVAATSRIVGRDGNDTQHALTWLVRRASAASTAKVLPSPACPCTAPIARAATRSATA